VLLFAIAALGVAGAKVRVPGPSSITAETPVVGTPITPIATAEIDFAALVAQQAQGIATAPPVRPLILDELEEPDEPGARAGTTAAQRASAFMQAFPTPRLNLASPAPTQNFMGLDDIPMVDSSYIIIPPDVDGAVGPTKVMEGLNNNYRIRDKATGVTQMTLGTATFWSPVAPVSELNQLTDPRTTYDPYNNCWIAVMQTVNANGDILLAVSKTSDPAGAWWLYRFTGFAAAYLLDFPIIGFNKNWIAITINRYTSAGSFSAGICLAVNYPLARTGTGSGTLFSQAAGSHFCTAPAVTYSATQDTLFLVTHLSSAGATYTVDRITGTPAAPAYTVGGTNVRPGGGWVQPSGNLLPQSAPNAGTAACTPPCKIETQDSQVRSSPVYRNGNLYYTQTLGLPSGTLTHTGVQWTRITASTTPTFVDGGRLEDPTATATNGGLWYAFPSIAVNAVGDFIVGFSQFSSAQHPAAGYAFHYGTDGAGTLRDAFIYKAGDDYYHKTFTTATGRNRWGDFSSSQVDPCDDMSLWTLQEYAKTRTGTNDGNTGSNSSKWSTWWANVGGPGRAVTLGCPTDTLGTPGSGVTRKFRITNTGAGTDQFNYSITDVAGWGGPVSGTTPPLAPASFFDVFVNFTISPNCSPVSDDVTLAVTPVGGSGCYTTQTCLTRIYCDFATATLVSHFDVEQAPTGVNLAWASEAVGEIQSWTVYRSRTADGSWDQVNEEPIAMGAGGDFQLHDDVGVVSGDVFYRLDARMAGGRDATLGTTRITLGAGRPFAFAISGGNPFSKRTTLSYTLPHADFVRVEVYSVAGQKVRTLVNRLDAAGTHTVDFALREGSSPLLPGVYLVRMSSGTFRKTLRVVGIE
jgi:hypothetical protein